MKLRRMRAAAARHLSWRATAANNVQLQRGDEMRGEPLKFKETSYATFFMACAAFLFYFYSFFFYYIQERSLKSYFLLLSLLLLSLFIIALGWGDGMRVLHISLIVLWHLLLFGCFSFFCM